MKLIDELTPPLRIRIYVGDIFAYSIRGTYRYLRVISDIDEVGRGRVVLYFYAATSSVLKQVPQLEKEQLILPPVLSWREVLRDGFSARVLRGGEYGPIDRWPVHCFETMGWPGPYCDEYGNRLPKRVEPCGDWGMPMSFGSLEIRIGKKLGIFETYEQHDKLPELPRPLFRKAREGKLPSPQVQVVLPGVGYETFAYLTKVQPSEDNRNKGGTWERAVQEAVYKVVQKVAGFSSVATQSWPPHLDADPPSIFAVVKKCQHQEFYSKIAEAMRILKIEEYYIQDAILHDWLAGTIKPTDQRPL